MDEVDWQKILRFYIRHVKSREGISFLVDRDGDYEGPIEGLTQSQVEALHQIALEEG